MTADILLRASDATAWKRAGRCCAAAPKPYKADCLMLASWLLQPSSNSGKIWFAYFVAPALPHLLNVDSTG